MKEQGDRCGWHSRSVASLSGKMDIAKWRTRMSMTMEDAIREDDEYLGSILPDPPVQVEIKARFWRISMERIDS